MEKIKIGRVVNAVALRGEVKVYNYSGYKERYEELTRIIVDDKEYEIEKVRYQQHMVILKLSGINDRNAAESLKTKDVYITEDDLLELPENTFYIRDLIGLAVEDADSGKQLGKLKDVLQPSSQDVYVVELAGGGQIMIPAVSEFIKEVNLKEGVISVHLIEGMIP
ncbi:ribosome maturation factor RimM [Anaerovoracaceae bacterium 41-7]|uniref:ribosome maturation factor RimM n=1 Tax=Emergencia sp. 1XD21-10 TaxID=2304569 RepID=UPI00137B1847|nr:ribosome maturation factor RimM [Emergencia sp. 1XD21-10]MCI9640268.1 16S rRNA processing protein RimM [Emergencia sp.]NCE98497.1 16S rRNA processing protein RimM [Emergencia sp. 1XD21-10]